MTDIIIDYIANNLKNYPLSKPQDIVKLLYQREFGPAHAIPDPRAARERLLSEYASSVQEEGRAFESIGNGYARLDLKRLDANGIAPEKAAEWFVKSAEPAGDKTAFAKMLSKLASDPRAEELLPGIKAFIAYYLTLGCPAVHHSEEYRKAYSPAYRVVREQFDPSK